MTDVPRGDDVETGGLDRRTFDAERAAPLVNQLIAVYEEVYPGGDAFHTEERYRRQITSHLTVPGWTLVTGARRGELVGYAYGFPLAPSTRWWQGLLTAVPGGFTDEDGHRTFAISEIMVRAPWRRQGIARTLQDELLAGRPEPRATLLAEPGNLPAQAAYARWGWRKVAELRPQWDNAPAFDVLVKDLPSSGSPPSAGHRRGRAPRTPPPAADPGHPSPPRAAPR